MNELRVCNRLRQFRSDKGLTQADLAKLARVSRKTINTLENEVFVPSVQLALVLSQVLGTTVEELFFLVSDGKRRGGQ